MDEHNILDGSYRARREPIDNIYTDYKLWFGRGSCETDDQQGFQASVNASPESTTHPTEPLAAQCAAALGIYGSRHVLEERCDMIRDLDTAHLLLKALVNRHTRRQVDVQVRVWHEVGVALEEGDLVEVCYSRLYNGIAMLGEVLSKDIGPKDVQLVVRTIKPLGFYEPWDFPLSLTDGRTFYEPWDA